jgi:hypothetical protein
MLVLGSRDGIEPAYRGVGRNFPERSHDDKVSSLYIECLIRGPAINLNIHGTFSIL